MQYAFNGFVLDSEGRELRSSGEPVPLEPQLFDVVELLLRCHDRVMQKDELIAEVCHQFLSCSNGNGNVGRGFRVITCPDRITEARTKSRRWAEGCLKIRRHSAEHVAATRLT